MIPKCPIGLGTVLVFAVLPWIFFVFSDKWSFFCIFLRFGFDNFEV